MIDKIKGYLMDALLAALAIAGAVIYYLSGRNKTLAGKVGELEAKEDIRKTLEKSEEAKNEANTSEDTYTKLRGEFIRNNDDGSNVH